MQKPSTVKPPRRPRPAAIACLVGCGLGVLLMLVGVGWSIWGDGRAAYQPAQAQEWDEASTALHAATIGHGHGPSTQGASSDGDREAAVAAARERFERADAALRSARFAKDRLGPLLVWIGLAIAAAFGVGYLAGRSE
jgi:hypothetical protein